MLDDFVIPWPDNGLWDFRGVALVLLDLHEGSNLVRVRDRHFQKMGNFAKNQSLHEPCKLLGNFVGFSATMQRITHLIASSSSSWGGNDRYDTMTSMRAEATPGGVLVFQWQPGFV